MFKKQFFNSDFLNVLSNEWQKTSEIAKKVGCSRAFASKTLLNMEEKVECRWVKGGKQGTREWRLKEIE